MPYRRLPNTDKARLRALENAFHQCNINGSQSVPCSENTFSSLKIFLPKFKNSIISFETDQKIQVKKNKDYTEILRKARMYLSHYIQVLNFTISRNELKPEIRAYYDLNKIGNSLPPLTSAENLLIWGKKIIEGDQKRIMNGGNPIYNPSIALVKVNYEKFTEAYHYQKILKHTTERSADIINNLRKEADQLILNLWNEIEAKFENETDQIKRKKSEIYGVVYVYRKNEIVKMKNEIEVKIEPKVETIKSEISEKNDDVYIYRKREFEKIKIPYLQSKLNF